MVRSEMIGILEDEWNDLSKKVVRTTVRRSTRATRKYCSGLNILTPERGKTSSVFWRKRGCLSTLGWSNGWGGLGPATFYRDSHLGASHRHKQTRQEEIYGCSTITHGRKRTHTNTLSFILNAHTHTYTHTHAHLLLLASKHWISCWPASRKSNRQCVGTKTRKWHFNFLHILIFFCITLLNEIIWRFINVEF